MARSVTGRAFLVGYYGAGNLGDEAIREAVERGAAARGWLVTHVAVRRDVADPRAVRLRRSPLAYLRAIRRSNLVIIGGGGILKDEGPGLPLELFLTALAGRLLRRRVAIIGVGVGPFYSRVGRALVSLTARLATTRSVRDRDSQDALRSMGIDSTLAADPVFALRADGPAPAPDGPTLLLSARPWFHNPGQDRAGMDRLTGALVGAIDDAAAAGWRVRLVSLYWPRDHELAVDLSRRASHPVRVDDRLDGWDALIDAVRASNAVIAMRYHALVAAVVAGRPAVAIAYEPKVRALAELVGVPVIDPAARTFAQDLRAAAADLVAGVGVVAGSPVTSRRVAELRAAAEAGLDLAFRTDRA